MQKKRAFPLTTPDQLNASARHTLPHTSSKLLVQTLPLTPRRLAVSTMYVPTCTAKAISPKVATLLPATGALNTLGRPRQRATPSLATKTERYRQESTRMTEAVDMRIP